MEADEGYSEPAHHCPKQRPTNTASRDSIIWVFPDTPNFLHYKSFDQIDLPAILGSESVVLVIAPIILRELNDKSDSHPNPRLKKRAAVAIKKLGEWAESHAPAKVREGVSLVFQPTEPLGLDFAAEQLDPNINDDRLLASFISYSKESPGARTILLSFDVGLRVKAQTRNIEIFRLPENAKLPTDPDPQEIEINELKKKLRDHESASPNLRLLFTSGKSVLEVVVRAAKFRPASEIQSLVEREHCRVPKFLVKTGTITSWALQEGKYLLPKEAERRNHVIDLYLQSYREYLTASDEHENRKKRRFEVPLMLVNDGGKPANDIDIVLSVPESINAFVRMEAVPGEPQPPAAPNWTAETEGSEASKSSDPISSPDPDANVSRPWIVMEKTGMSVRFHVKKIKHRYRITLPSILFEFDTVESVRSFAIDYTLLADNVPREVDGSLNVVVTKGAF
jgi:hypothetical protein